MNYNKQESSMIINERTLSYPVALLLSNATKKTAEALSKTLDISGDTVLRILEDECITWEDLVALAKQYFGTNKVRIIIDDTLIEKMYSKYIGGSGDNYDPVTKKTYRSICTVVAMLSDGKIAIPVLHALWVEEAFSGEHYKTKTEIAQELLEKLKGKLDIYIALMDGLYATLNMVKWSREKCNPYEMRFHANRRVALDQNNLDKTVKISACKELQLKGKKSCKTIEAWWHGERVYITAVRRTKRNGSTIIVYQISNVKMSARSHMLEYDCRWEIEKFFRTGKQHLGLTECQSRKKDLQEKHIYNVFLAYAILQFERKKNRFKNPEEALHAIKRKDNIPIDIHLKRVGQIFRNNEGAHA
jgi:hypothetical protein